MLLQEKITVTTRGFSDVIDLSSRITDFLGKIDGSGLLNVFVPGSTAGVTTIEFESGCVYDLKEALNKIAPEDEYYKHNERWGDGNGFSHLRAALLGPGLTVPFQSGQLQTGTWQQVILVDCDNKERQRTVLLTAYLSPEAGGQIEI